MGFTRKTRRDLRRSYRSLNTGAVGALADGSFRLSKGRLFRQIGRRDASLDPKCPAGVAPATRNPDNAQKPDGPAQKSRTLPAFSVSTGRFVEAT